jgi:hypothetical protein
MTTHACRLAVADRELRARPPQIELADLTVQAAPTASVGSIGISSPEGHPA